MTIKVREDESARGGFAFLDLDRSLPGDQVRVSFLRLDIDSRYLGLDEWQVEQAWLTPDRIEQHGNKTTLRLGPDIIDRIPDLVPVEVAVDGIGIVGTVTWPSLAKSGRGLASVRITAPRATNVPPLSVSPPPPPPPLPLPPVQRPIEPPPPPKPQPPAAPVAPTVSKASNRLLLPMMLALLLVLAAGGYWLFGRSIEPDLQTAQEPITFTGPAGGPFVQSGEYDLRSGDRDVNWQFAPLPNWLSAAPARGIVNRHQREVIRLAVWPSATQQMQPGTLSETISVTYGSDNKSLKREIRLVIERVSRQPLLTSDRSDIITFAGPAGGPFGSSPVAVRLSARDGDVSWSISGSYPGWLSVSPSEGRLSANQSQTVNFAVKPMPANLSGPGDYNGEVVFVGNQAGQTLVQKVRLAVRAPPAPPPAPPPPPPPPPGQLTGNMTPITFTGFKGDGRYTPESASATIRALGTGFGWTMIASPQWLDVSPRSGSLYNDGAADITMRPNGSANSRSVGSYTDMVVFTKNGGGQRLDQVVKLVVLDPTAECDRLMTTQFDNDSPPGQPFVSNVDMSSDADIELAITACTLSARDTNLRRSMSQAGRAYASRAQRRAKVPDEFGARSDMNEALRLWMRASDAGSGSGMNFLGAYYRGTFNSTITFIQPDYPTALRYWLMGANTGHARAMTNAGAMFLFGKEQYAPIEKSPERARDLLTRAANRSEWGAVALLGMAYFSGDPFPKNISQGIQMITNACLNGAPEARAFFDREYARPQRREGIPSQRPTGC